MASHRDSCHLAPPAYDSLSLYGLLEKSGLINPGAPHVSFLPPVKSARTSQANEAAGSIETDAGFSAVI
jgi:hypothetical protein